MTRPIQKLECRGQQRTIIVRITDDMAIFRRRDRQLVEPIVRRLVAVHYHAVDAQLARRLAHVDEHGRIHLRATLVGDVERELQLLGCRVERRLRRRSTLIRATADVQFLGLDHPPHIGRLLDFLHYQPQGRIYYRWIEHLYELIGLIARLYPHLNILVVTTNWRTARQIAARLPSTSTRPVYARVNPRNLWQSPLRIHVGPLARFQAVNELDWHIVIFADPAAALARSSIGMSAGLPSQLQFVLVPHDRQFDRDDQFWLRFLFGDAAFYALPVEDRPTAVRVLFARGASDEKPRIKSALLRKREAIWNNTSRNHLIAQTARACSRRDVDSLQALGVIAEADRNVLDRLGTVPRVVIVVEVPEHGRTLQAYLPDWTLVTATNWTGNGHPDHAIVTSVWAERHGIRADVVIRADGTGSPWNRRWGPSSQLTADQQLIVIDILDNFDAVARRDTSRRIANYLDHGWAMSEVAIEFAQRHQTVGRKRAGQAQQMVLHRVDEYTYP